MKKGTAESSQKVPFGNAPPVTAASASSGSAACAPEASALALVGVLPAAPAAEDAAAAPAAAAAGEAVRASFTCTFEPIKAPSAAAARGTPSVQETAVALRGELAATRNLILALEERLARGAAAARGDPIASASPALPTNLWLLLLTGFLVVLVGRSAPAPRVGAAAGGRASAPAGGVRGGRHEGGGARCARAQAEAAGASFSWSLRREPSTLTAAAPGGRRRRGEVAWEPIDRDDTPPAGDAAPLLGNITLGSTDVLGCRDVRGCLEYALELPGCNLSAISPAAARTCLAGRHVMFVGDSVTRYQFLNFAQMLEHGAHVAWDPPTEHDNHFGTWENFFAATTERLGPHGVCDCFRPGNSEKQAVVNAPDGNEVWGVLGTRYYRHPAARLEATFVEALGRHPNTVWHEPRALGVDCHKSPWGLDHTDGQVCPAKPLCAPGYCRAPFHHVERWDVGLRKLIARTQPDALVINSGLWGVQWREPASSRVRGTHLERLLSALDWAAAPAPRGGGVRTIVWKTTTAQLDGVPGAFDFRPLATQGEELVVAAFRARGWPVLDTHALSLPLKALALADADSRRRIYFKDDAVHFSRPIYRAFNELLLAMLCEGSGAGDTPPTPSPPSPPPSARPPRTCASSAATGPFPDTDLDGARTDKQRLEGLKGVSVGECCQACVDDAQCNGYVWKEAGAPTEENCWTLKNVFAVKKTPQRTAGVFGDLLPQEPDWTL